MDDDENLPLVEQTKKPEKWRNTKIGLFQFWSAAGLTVLSYLQIHALINSLALNWTFPEQYSKSSSFLFFINLDIWEFAKVTSKTYPYVAQSARPTPSEEVMEWFKTRFAIKL